MKKGPNNGKLLLLIECSIFKIVFRKHQYTGVGASNMCNQVAPNYAHVRAAHVVLSIYYHNNKT